MAVKNVQLNEKIATIKSQIYAQEAKMINERNKLNDLKAELASIKAKGK